MVNTAKAETALAEKLLKEANGKIDVLQAEVKALKELVLTSTPSTPNKHLYPHLSSSNSNSSSQSKSHSRQSSLNQQSLNSVVQPVSSQTAIIVTHNYPAATSTPSSSSNTHLSNPLTKSDTKLTVSHSTHSFQAMPKEKVSLFSKSHKRVPSHNDVQFHPKSLIDKLFNQNNGQQNYQQQNESLNGTYISDNNSSQFTAEVNINITRKNCLKS